jgi:hypothetical protein
MGKASKIISVLLRIGECICAIIVVAILGHFLHLLDVANADADGRLIYAEVISGLCIVFSLILSVPIKYTFYAFPLDGILFICTMVAFGLLANVSSI